MSKIQRFLRQVTYLNQQLTPTLIHQRHHHKMTLNPCADVHIIPMLADNYGYLIVDRATKQGAVVDPVTPTAVLDKVKEVGAELSVVLTTHKHWDHAGGNIELDKLTNHRLKFIGSGYEETPGVNHPVKDGDTFKIGNLSGTAYHAPCHTKGHILYYIENPSRDHSSSPLLFTGDTLFVGGCGRFFEGSANEMVSNMTKIKGFPDATLLYVGHEYTVKNLEFAHSLEPHHNAVNVKLEWAKQKRLESEPTVPALLTEEKLYNPFLRFDDPDLMKVLKTKTPEETMAECRSKKDLF